MHLEMRFEGSDQGEEDVEREFEDVRERAGAGGCSVFRKRDTQILSNGSDEEGVISQHMAHRRALQNAQQQFQRQDL